MKRHDEYEIKSNKQILLKIILSFMSIVLIVILVLSTFLYSYFESKMQEQIYQYSLTQLRQTTNTVEFLSEYVQSVFIRLTNDSAAMDLITTKDCNGNNNVVRKGLTQLDKVRLSSSQIHSIYLYNKNCDVVFTSGSNETSTIHNMKDFYDSDFQDIVKHMDQKSRFVPYYRAITVRENYQTSIYTYFYYTKSNTGRIDNIIAINFSSDWIKKSVGYFNNPDDQHSIIKIIDGNNNVVLSQDSLEQKNDKALTSYQNIIAQKKEIQGFFLDGVGGNKKLVAYVRPQKWGYEDWTFFSINNYDTITKPIQSAKTIVVVVCLTIILVSSFIVLLLSNKIYKPIKNRIEKLETQQNIDFEMKKQYYLINLLNTKNDAQEVEVKQNFEKYKIRFCYSSQLMVMILTVDNYMTFKKRQNDILNQRIAKLQLDVSKLISKDIEHYEILSFHDGILPVVFEVNEEMDCNNLVNKLFAALTKQKHSVSICLSSQGYTYRDLPFLYKEAITAKSYLFVKGLHNVIFYEDYVEEKKNCLPNLPETERNLVSKLFSAKEEEARHILENLFVELKQVDIDNIRLTFLHLAYAIKYYYQTNISFVLTTLDNFDLFIQKMQTLETMEQVQNMFVNLFSEITEIIQENTKNKYDSLICTIEEMVKHNYSDPVFCINYVSDKVNMSSAYIGKLFKKAKAQSFTEYLNDYRLNQACFLLENTNNTVNAISESIGFANTSYFFNMFKKKYNITPAAYRLKYKK